MVTNLANRGVLLNSRSVSWFSALCIALAFAVLTSLVGPPALAEEASGDSGSSSEAAPEEEPAPEPSETHEDAPPSEAPASEDPAPTSEEPSTEPSPSPSSISSEEGSASSTDESTQTESEPPPASESDTFEISPGTTTAEAPPEIVQWVICMAQNWETPDNCSLPEPEIPRLEELCDIINLTNCDPTTLLDTICNVLFECELPNVDPDYWTNYLCNVVLDGCSFDPPPLPCESDPLGCVPPLPCENDPLGCVPPLPCEEDPDACVPPVPEPCNYIPCEVPPIPCEEDPMGCVPPLPCESNPLGCVPPLPCSGLSCVPDVDPNDVLCQFEGCDPTNEIPPLPCSGTGCVPPVVVPPLPPISGCNPVPLPTCQIGAAEALLAFGDPVSGVSDIAVNGTGKLYLSDTGEVLPDETPAAIKTALFDILKPVDGGGGGEAKCSDAYHRIIYRTPNKQKVAELRLDVIWCWDDGVIDYLAPWTYTWVDDDWRTKAWFDAYGGNYTSKCLSSKGDTVGTEPSSRCTLIRTTGYWSVDRGSCPYCYTTYPTIYIDTAVGGGSDSHHTDAR